MPRTKQEAIAEFRVETILEAAHRVFSAKGYEGATIQEIAEAAGIAKGTVYLYYESKLDLYWATLKQGMEELRVQTVAAVGAAASPEEAIRAFIRTKADHFEKHRDFFAMYFTEFGQAVVMRAPCQQAIDDSYIAQTGILAEAIAKGIEEGRVRPVNARKVAFAVFDVTRGLVARRTRGWSSATLDEDVETAFDLVWKGLAAR